MRVGGVVVCGGRSSRMGRSKAMLPFGSEVLLQRVVRCVSEVVDPVVVVAAPGQELPPLPDGVCIVRDPVEGRGPLQGLATGLEAMRDDVEAVYLASCDCPFLKPAFIRRLIELTGSASVCVPRVDDFYHPLAAVYRTEVLRVVEELLAAGKRRPVDLFEAVSTRIVREEELRDVDPAFESLRNVNTPDEYQVALHDAEVIGKR